MMIALRTDPVTLLQRDLVNDRPTGRTLVPQAFRHIGLFLSGRFERSFLEKRHGTRDRVEDCLCFSKKEISSAVIFRSLEASTVAKIGAFTTYFVGSPKTIRTAAPFAPLPSKDRNRNDGTISAIAFPKDPGAL